MSCVINSSQERLLSPLEMEKLKNFPKCLPDSRKYNDAYIFGSQLERLDKAHDIAEQLCIIFTLSCKTQHLYRGFKTRRNELSEKIVTIVTSVHQEKEGSRCLRECVDSGWYLTVLRIYFFYKPEALKNHASNPDMAAPFQNTILHHAVWPNAVPVYFPFLSFVLSMDKKHNLQLSTFANIQHQNPLQYVAGRNSIFRTADPERQERFLKVKEMLLEHNPSLSEQSLPPQCSLPPPTDTRRIDRLPDGSFMISFDPSIELSSSESEENESLIPAAQINHSGDANEIFAVPQQNQIERDPIITPPPATASNYFSNLISYVWDSFSALLNWLRSFF